MYDGASHDSRRFAIGALSSLDKVAVAKHHDAYILALSARHDLF